MNSRPIEVRFWEKVRKGPGCWAWTGSRSNAGYGAIFWEGRRWMATHLSLGLAGRPLTNGLWALHKCDNPSCVRPDHLEAGTQRKNITDCVLRGRHFAPKGERNGNAILTAAIVSKIRAEYDGERGSMARLSKEYGVTISAIHAIIRKITWGEVLE